MRSLRLGWSLLLLFCSGLAWSQPFVIDRFFADITVREDGLLQVQEKIDTTFVETRRGIIRVIPQQFDTGKGVARVTRITGISVTDERGTKQPIKVTREGAFVRIRVGEETVFFPAGTKKTYVINYSVQNAINWFDANETWQPYAEIYWNVTGNAWDTSIGKAGFVVNFPKTDLTKVDPGDFRARMFYGYTGSTSGLDLARTGVVSNRESQLELGTQNLKGTFNNRLETNQGLTFVLAVPEKMLPRPPAWRSAWWFLQANMGFFLPVPVLIILLIVWAKIGRDPKPPYPGPQFEPPDALSAPECGALIDGSVDPRDISAGIVSLAVKGHLQIQSTNPHGKFRVKDTELVVKKPDKPSVLTKFEKDLLDEIGVPGQVVEVSDLRTLVGPNLLTLRGTLMNQLVHAGYYRTDPTKVVASTTGCGCFVAFIAIFAVAQFMATGPDLLSYIVGGVLSGILIFLFAGLMPRRTMTGAVALQKLRGFEEAMRGRGEYLDWFSKTNLDMAKYEEFLPYAVAFDLVEEWSTICAPVITRNPDWFISPTPGVHFNAMTFSDSLTSATRSFASTAGTPPRTSSSSGSSGFSSGGGFSGGGFGGGGGSSW